MIKTVLPLRNPVPSKSASKINCFDFPSDEILPSGFTIHPLIFFSLTLGEYQRLILV
nr:MAG TPA: hypothetical protein [Caudoviricetes sp.]DAW30879.1 MAG TPA: hypothetical protein [Caudoviricetes sp.]